MKIVVCVKQVPFIGELRFSSERGVLVRDGVTNVVNAFDRPAIVAAVEMAAERGGEVVAITLGPPDARAVLREALALGAGRAVHLCDPAFAGSDTLATARTLAAAIRREGPVDLVLVGQRSTDADTALIGPLLAGFLDLPLIAGVTACHLSEDGRTVTAEREIENGPEALAVRLPALLTAAERLRPAVALSPEAKAAAAAKPLVTLSVVDLNLSPEEAGAAGSATRVLATHSVAKQRAGIIISGDDPVAAAEALARVLIERGIFDAVPDAPDVSAPGLPVSPGATGAIWAILAPVDLAGPAGAAVLALTRRAANDGAIRDASFGRSFVSEANQGPRASAPGQDASTPGPFLSRSSAEAMPQTAASETFPSAIATEVILSGPADPAHFEHLTARRIPRVRLPADSTASPSPEAFAAYLSAAIERDRPLLVLLPATDAGREIAGRVAAARGLGIVSDCHDITWDEAGRPVLIRPALGGDLHVSVGGRTHPLLATISSQRQLPHATLPSRMQSLAAADRADAPAPVPDRPGTPTALEYFDVPPAGRGVHVLRAAPPAGHSGFNLITAPIVVGVGRGAGPPENHAPIEELAGVIGGVIGATRKVTDAGWLSRERQIGLTGRAIAPRFYLAIGIRGLSHHAVGIRRAETIAVINDNHKAPIWSLADTGVVGDWTLIVPHLTVALRRLRPAPE